jgi:hypothetical protein
LSGRTLNLEERKAQCEVLVKYVKETFHMHNFYAIKYFVCDILNFVNVIGQMYLINKYGFNVPSPKCRKSKFRTHLTPTDSPPHELGDSQHKRLG